MALHNKELLNRLQVALPEGVIAPMSWLQKQGYSRQLVSQYAKNGWLKNLGHGAYAKPGMPVNWQGIVLGLQELSKLTCHVGGMSALNYQGLAHYLPLGGRENITLWGKKIPAWAGKLEQPISLNRKALFIEDPKKKLGLIKLKTNVRDWCIWASSPERAIIEVFSTIKKNEEDFTAAAEMIEGLMTLRPQLLQNLLEACQDIKAKRVFLYLAEYYHMPWITKLNLDKISVGAGKRQVVAGGRLDKKYQITIPKEFSP